MKYVSFDFARTTINGIYCDIVSSKALYDRLAFNLTELFETTLALKLYHR